MSHHDRRLSPGAYEEFVSSQFLNLVHESARLINYGRVLGAVDETVEAIDLSKMEVIAGAVPVLARFKKYGRMPEERVVTGSEGAHGSIPAQIETATNLYVKKSRLSKGSIVRILSAMADLVNDDIDRINRGIASYQPLQIQR